MALTPYDLKKLQKNPRFYEIALSNNLQSLETAINNVTGGGGSGDVTNASNLGAGTGLFTSKAAGVLQFKSLQATGYASLTNTGTEITINGTSISLPQSAGWNSSYTTVNANSAIQWNYQGTDLRALSANWQSTYTQVKALSDSWEESIDINNLSAQVISLQISSIAWDSSWTQVNTLSSGWMLSGTEVDLGQIPSLSGGWNSVYSQVNNLSSGWSSVYTTINNNSAIWISDISSLSGQVIDLNTNLHSVSTDLEAMIDSVSASIQSITGQYEMNFADYDWIGPSPYTITIPPATHYQGSLKDLNVVVKEDFGSENKIVYDSPSINDNGTVILTTTTPYSGSVIIGKMGGFTAADVTNAKKGQITCIFDGLGVVLAVGLKAYVLIENDAVIESWTATGDGNVGSLVVDVWKCPYASFPPTVVNTIAGTEKPTIAAAKNSQDSNLTTWTTQVNKNDYIGFKVDSCSTFTKASITLKISK